MAAHVLGMVACVCASPCIHLFAQLCLGAPGWGWVRLPLAQPLPPLPAAPHPCPALPSPQRFFQVVSYMVDAENRDKWEDAQQVSCLPGVPGLLQGREEAHRLAGGGGGWGPCLEVTA